MLSEEFTSKGPGIHGLESSLREEPRSRRNISISDFAVSLFRHIAGVLKSTFRGAKERLVLIIRMAEEPRLSDPRIPTQVWMLGVSYDLSALQEVEAGKPEVGSDNATAGDQSYFLVSSPDAHIAFKNDMRSRFWFTYRRNFEPIRNSGLTTDAGWGCMLRSGQMMIAQALVHHHLGRAWRLPERVDPSTTPAAYFQILRLFHDHPTSLFSIHNIAIAGEDVGKKKIGQWLGPCTVCAAFARLHSRVPSYAASSASALSEGPGGALQLLLFDSKDGDNTIYRQTARPLLERGATLLLLPVRLGAHTVDPSYVPKLADVFRLPQSVGFVGGRPSSAHYFVASRGEVVYYLDPHSTQEALLDASKASSHGSAGWHCNSLRHMWLKDIDASLTLGFYCTNIADFEDLCARITAINSSHSGYPAVFIAEKPPPQTAAWDGDDDDAEDDC